MEVWPGAAVELVPALRKNVRSAPRAGIAVLIHPRISYTVSHIINEKEEVANGIIQAITMVLQGGMSITGASVSPSVTKAGLLTLLDMVITEGMDREVLTGDCSGLSSNASH